MHNPWAKWRISCDWECHLARGSAGGIDYAVSNGTPIRAAFTGTLRNRTTGNLYTAILTADHNPKLAFYHLHLARYATPGHYNEGDIIGWTGGIKGAVGSGNSTGPHLHVNAYLNGVIRNVTDFFGGTAGLDPQPINTEETDMQPIYAIVQDTENSRPEYYGSMAVFGPLVPNGFQQISTGLGPRDRFSAWQAIAAKIPGVGDINATMIHVDWVGWQIARDLFTQPVVAATVDIPALVAAIKAAGVIDDSDATAQKVLEALSDALRE